MKYAADLNVSHLLKRSTTQSEINNCNKTLVVPSSSRISKAEQLEQNKNARTTQHGATIFDSTGLLSAKQSAAIQLFSLPQLPKGFNSNPAPSQMAIHGRLLM